MLWKKNKNDATERRTNQQSIKQKMLGKKSSFAAVEAYKSTRTNLMFIGDGEGCKKIVFTSTFVGEGKTTNCINLAITLAQNGQKVLLIDADMRRPTAKGVFEINTKVGLSEILAGLATWENETEEEPYIYRSKRRNLFVLHSGHIPPNPAELLASKQMKNLLEKCEKEFDYIIIDTPPISVVTDAAVLANVVNGYVIVVRAGVTPKDSLSESVLRLEQLGANIIGFILNDVDPKTSLYKHSSGRYKYGSSKYHKYGYGGYDDVQEDSE
ncbi:Tyrosine-protein kinase YwqD [bioreactor metagenome]|uniref:non-specific protein-tyrosine kinase n=1 Tax=bioreactor metagenome TaxID=1076179 RepID=A0A645E1K8_9ZZZZ|nr:CpsD/CapB family tyrosine-protein kinase [Candidatus Metalachnospira sp.]